MKRDGHHAVLQDGFDKRAFAETLRMAMQNLPTGVIWFDTEQHCIYANSEAFRLFEVPDDLQELEAILTNWFQEAVSKGIRFSHEYQSTDMYIVAVPTPYDKASKKVDASYVVKAVQNVMSVCPKAQRWLSNLPYLREPSINMCVRSLNPTDLPSARISIWCMHRSVSFREIWYMS